MKKDAVSFGNTVTLLLRSFFPSPMSDRNSEVPLLLRFMTMIKGRYITPVCPVPCIEVLIVNIFIALTFDCLRPMHCTTFIWLCG